MRCQNENGCDGELDFSRPVDLMIGCSSFREAFPCGKCGRLHFSGEAVVNRQGHRAFFEDDIVVNKDEKGVEHGRL